MTNQEIVAETLKQSGITNRYAISAIMAIIQKESGFNPRSETSYSKTSNARIKSIFSKTKSLSDDALTKLKSNDVDFFNYVYGGKYGNTEKEGYKYRGRGLNQLTFKANYIKFGKLTGTDLVNKPDLANDISVASKVVAQYFIENFKTNAKIVKSRYNADNINDFQDSKTAVNAFYNANAGFGKDTSKQTTEGKTRALSVVDSFLEYADKAVKGAIKYADENKGKVSIGALLLVAGGIYYAYTKNLIRL